MSACNDACETCGDASVDGGGKDVTQDGPSVCPSGKEPKDDPTCVADALGIFVAPSPTGNDTNAGTKAAPVASLKAALAKVGGKSFIFVCEGNYTESVDIKQSASIYGGFKCADWTYSGALPKFTGTKSDYVLHLDTANDTIIADLELDAIDATPNTGASSIGAFVATSQNVTFERVTIHAGKGADGPSGTLTPLGAQWPDAGALTGNNASGSTGGGTNSVACPGASGTTVGGKGGNGTLNAQFSAGASGLPALGGGAGGIGSDGGSSCNNGGSGNVGDAGANAPSLGVVGDFSDGGWQPASGASGSVGGPGQGGGGGGGADNGSFQGGGGGGGVGACGGAGGTGGAGGGASVAVASESSSITLKVSTFVCTAAGNGGNGVAGEAGQKPGGAGGVQVFPGCSGGGGGNGGAGGAGGGGAGGVSVGVLSKGGTVNIDSTTQSNITVAPQGGTKGTGAAGNDGIAGVAQPTLAL